MEIRKEEKGNLYLLNHSDSKWFSYVGNRTPVAQKDACEYLKRSCDFEAEVHVAGLFFLGGYAPF